ncbi:DapH/DapD/GlmU-related protein [Bacillus sp. 165]|uniref:serine acetyltransferase n=1 Tax=Bacillus sp. 165 TaxID=1529117 RepID=UPI001ADD0790|nr:DapH/DapD/GlmU-related protein [Bacillus sp. 165]MBO9130026.1 serine acetyltransferase [Bacillus sp. 165]
MKYFLKDLKMNNKADPIIIISLAIYRFGNYIYSHFRVPVFKTIFWLFYRICDFIFIRIIANGQLPAESKIGSGIRFPHGLNGIIIHKNAQIGKNATIFHQVTIGYKDSPTCSYGPPILGDNVYIGAGAKILGDIRIDDNVVIGANAVVVKDIKANNTAVGVPAEILLVQRSRIN